MSTSQEKRIEQAKALTRKYMREGWGSRASILYAIYDLFPTELSEEMFVKVCWVLDPLPAPAAAMYENEHGFECPSGKESLPTCRRQSTKR